MICSGPIDLANYPLVSILTVVYNGEAHLEETIQSVITQDYPNFEYVVVDGASSDGTQSILESYSDCVDVLVSEPDSGIYNAINKGLGLCSGAIIKIQNADDLLLPGAISAAVAILQEFGPEQPALLIGDSRVINQGSEVVGRITQKPVMWGFDSFNHPAWFATSSLYERFGQYNEEYLISADYEYYLRLKNAGARIVRTSIDLAAYRQDGASSGFTGVWEVFAINLKYIGFTLASVVGAQHLAGKLLRPAVRWLRRRKKPRYRMRK